MGFVALVVVFFVVVWLGLIVVVFLVVLVVVFFVVFLVALVVAGFKVITLVVRVALDVALGELVVFLLRIIDVLFSMLMLPI